MECEVVVYREADNLTIFFLFHLIQWGYTRDPIRLFTGSVCNILQCIGIIGMNVVVMKLCYIVSIICVLLLR
jgi:hypothetical protein